MSFVSRGFRGRRRDSDADPSRVPPGQYLTDDFPVLSAGPTPHTPLERVDVRDRRRRRAEDLDLGRVPRAPERDGHGRHPLRHPLVEARHDLGRRLGRHAARGGRARRPLRARLLRRRLHDEPPARGRHRRQGVGRLRLRRRAARAGARRAGAACSSRTSTSGRAPSGCGASSSATRTSPASGRRTATTSTETRGSSSATRATELAARHGRRTSSTRRLACGRSCSTSRTGPGTAPGSTSTCG